ncbi:MAG: hypothetical protein EGR26_08880 [Clostridiales bacterium]|nr:hypothetical protein [Clostridiales bacterium]
MALKKITDAEMDAAGVVAAPDVLSGTPAQNKAVFDRMVRQLVAPAYNAAVDAINEIDDVEKGIETAEAQRVEAENARAAAETERQNAEADRQTAETERQNAEEARQSAETAREDKETGYVADAEAWARGTRNGVAVGASDPAYENNAAYYRDQARSVVGGEYVSFGQAQPLTAAQKQQARENIGAPAPYTAGDGIAISGSVISAKARPWNRNLLDNWYFGAPVNQRDVSGTISSAGYFLDRWKLVSGSVTINTDGITLNGTMQQVLETAPVGTVTASALTQAGVGEVVPTYNSATKTVTVTAAGKKLVAVKLELGSQQTLAHQVGGAWVLSEMPDYGEELTKCMRYLQIITTPYDTSGNGVAIGYANNTVDLWVPIPLAVPMRISPTPTIPTGGVSLFKLGKTSNALKDVTKVTGGWAMQTGGACSVRSLIFMASGLTAGETYALFMRQGAQIVFSAEL